MRIRHLLLAPALLLGTAALAADPVEVTRFHTADTLARLGPGPVEVVAAPGVDTASLESRAWLDAVARELSAQGFAAAPGGAPRVAEVRLTRDVVEGGEVRRGGSSVSVGVGVGSGWGGGWRRHGGSHVGVGVGIGFPVIGGGSRRGDAVESELSVTIRDKATGAALWEGRSNLRTSRRKADDPETAGRLAAALFAGFPGRSGETIEVK
jgi:hypothetical protein